MIASLVALVREGFLLALLLAAPILVAMRAPGAPEPRVTLSAPVLAGAMCVLASHRVTVAGGERQVAYRTEKITRRVCRALAAQSVPVEETPRTEGARRRGGSACRAE